MKVKEIIDWIEEVAPVSLQESYDNCGLHVGNRDTDVTGVLITLDVTEEVIAEAISNNCNLIISHHPIIFSGLKRVTGDDFVQRCVIQAIKNDIAVYAAHTNMDNVMRGVNGLIADKINLTNRAVLSPKSGLLSKLVTFVPHAHLASVRQALFNAGAGTIGNYDFCSYSAEGIGTFRANDSANPYVGSINELHSEPETRIEVIYPRYLKNNVIAALRRSHPYEEPAFDIISLENECSIVGAGIVGELENDIDESAFLKLVKDRFAVGTIKHTRLLGKKIRKVALCGGAGSSFLPYALAHGADVYLSGDFKYHDFFNADDKILIMDIGHYESEQYTKEIFYEIITKKIANFAVRISQVNTNPINYF